MKDLAPVLVQKGLVQRLNRLKKEKFFVPNYLLFAKIFSRITDEQLLTLIEDVRQERDLAMYNYIKPEIDTTPQQYIYPEPSAQ